MWMKGAESSVMCEALIPPWKAQSWPIHQVVSKKILWWNFKVLSAVWLHKQCSQTKTYSSTEVSTVYSLLLEKRVKTEKKTKHHRRHLCIVTENQLKPDVCVLFCVLCGSLLCDLARSQVYITLSCVEKVITSEPQYSNCECFVMKNHMYSLWLKKKKSLKMKHLKFGFKITWAV